MRDFGKAGFQEKVLFWGIYPLAKELLILFLPRAWEEAVFQWIEQAEMSAALCVLKSASAWKGNGCTFWCPYPSLWDLHVMLNPPLSSSLECRRYFVTAHRPGPVLGEQWLREPILQVGALTMTVFIWDQRFRLKDQSLQRSRVWF